MNRKPLWTILFATAALTAGSIGSASAASYDLRSTDVPQQQIQDRYDYDDRYRDGVIVDRDLRDGNLDRDYRDGNWDREHRDGNWRDGQRHWLSDRELRDRVSVALDRRLGNAARRIEVRVANRDVYLSGAVRHPGDRMRAYEIANNVRGVDDVSAANLYVRRYRY